ncbi:MAG TPA: sulfatase [Cyclobacteriaceae bacterium]|nr:sulfatase [Cyclobacteriaceae bacterium]
MLRLIVLSLLVLMISCKTETKKRPNVIIIMTDDHAKNAVSAFGSKMINTPNIDRIAKEGIKFNNAFVTNALCGPSRAVILTGKYSHINGFRDNQSVFDNRQMTFIKLLKEAGYYTAVVGKWHLVTEPTGFDYWNILDDQGSYYNPDFIEMGDTTRKVGYTTDLVTDEALKVLDKQTDDKPFCLMLHQKAPHRNWMPNFKHFGMFDKDTIPLPETFFDDYSTRSDAARQQDMEIVNMFRSSDMKLILPAGMKDPGSGGGNGFDGAKIWAADYERFNEEQKQLWDAYYKPISDAFYKMNPKGDDLKKWMYERYMKDYLACVASVDENIGRLLDYLERRKMLDNTLIIYTSDQGFFLGEHGWYDKRFMYEESLGTPLVMRYPQRMPGGLVSEQLVLNLDIAPTILEAAGLTVPADMQGRSLLPLMNATPQKEWRSSVYYHYYEFPYGWHNVKKHYGLRTDRYKLIRFYNDIDAWELYDLKNDPKELHNIYDDPENKQLVDSLKLELDKLRTEFKDTVGLEYPTSNTPH